MLHDWNYNKVKVLHGLSETAWFIQKHAIPDAKRAKHPLSVKMFGEMLGDLEKHIEKIKLAIAGLSKEEKFK